MFIMVIPIIIGRIRGSIICIVEITVIYQHISYAQNEKMIPLIKFFKNIKNSLSTKNINLYQKETL